AILGLGQCRRAGASEGGQPTEGVRTQRRAAGTFLVVTGILLLGLAGWMVFSQGLLPAFGEAVGAALLGLVAVATGLTQMQPLDAAPFHERILNWLLRKRGLVSNAILVLDLALLVIAWFVGQSQGWAGFPIWFGLVLLSLITLGAALWLRL